MTIEEANKIIAKYMGLYVHKKNIVTSVRLGRVNGSFVGSLYSDSLDALVPVWERMNIKLDFEIVLSHFPDGTCYDSKFVNITEYKSDTSIQHAACIATARAIKELNQTKGGG